MSEYTKQLVEQYNQLASEAYQKAQSIRDDRGRTWEAYQVAMEQYHVYRSRAEAIRSHALHS